MGSTAGAVSLALAGPLRLALSLTEAVPLAHTGSLGLALPLTGAVSLARAGSLGLTLSLTGTISLAHARTLGLPLSLTGAVPLAHTRTLGRALSLTGAIPLAAVTLRVQLAQKPLKLSHGHVLSFFHSELGIPFQNLFIDPVFSQGHSHLMGFFPFFQGAFLTQHIAAI